LQESFIDKSPFSFENVKVLGVAFLTYLILQIGEDIIFVDQHAAHERILYDKFMLVHNASHMQPLLSPFVFLADDAEAAFIEENLAEINEGGIEVQPFGDNTFRITAVSTVFSNVAVDTLVRSILRSINEIKFDSKQLISDAVAKRACKAATKAGRHLNDDEIEYIIRAMAQNKALCCPHGRPLTVTISKSEFEKMFKRTV
jgi:DNA mismatch repair protein MutL